MHKEENKKQPLQPRKAESKPAFTAGGKKPKEEKEHRLETQPRKSEKKHAGTEGHVGHAEEFHPEDFSRFGTRFITESAVKKGM